MQEEWPYAEIKKDCDDIPAKVFWLKGKRFLSWECQDFWKRHVCSRRLLKTSEDTRSFPNMFRIILKFSRKLLCSIRTFKNQRFRAKYRPLPILHGLFVSRIGLSLQIFGKCVGKAAIARIRQPAVRNWSVRLTWREIEVFNRRRVTRV